MAMPEWAVAMQSTVEKLLQPFAFGYLCGAILHMQQLSTRPIGIWLLIGVGMVLIQVAIGGITRLTGSGLSITRWEVITGTLPPMNEAQWEEAFDLYKESPQYQKVTTGMSMGEFKFIYFWEWFHRLWARMLGVVFLVPFVWFIATRRMTRPLMAKAGIAFLLGGLVGVFGWIMVASGLSDRPMVSPYRLALHLSLAIVTLCYLYWVALQILAPKDPDRPGLKTIRNWAVMITVLVSAQIILGALVSGMRAAPFYPTWPLMNGSFVPAAMQDATNWSWSSFLHFDRELFPVAFVQFAHRNLAYLIIFLSAIFLAKGLRTARQPATRSALAITGVVLTVQVLLGIFTLVGSVGSVPVMLGVLHQVVAIVLLMSLLWLLYRLSGPDDAGQMPKQ
jgi:heme a synthase